MLIHIFHFCSYLSVIPSNVKLFLDNKNSSFPKKKLGCVFLSFYSHCRNISNSLATLNSWLYSQNHTLEHVELNISVRVQATVEAVQELIKKHEEFSKKMDAQDDKINQMIQFAQRLANEGHYAQDKITEKAQSLHDRRNANRQKMEAALQRLRDALALQQFIQDAEDVSHFYCIVIIILPPQIDS